MRNAESRERGRRCERERGREGKYVLIELLRMPFFKKSLNVFLL